MIKVKFFFYFGIFGVNCLFDAGVYFRILHDISNGSPDSGGFCFGVFGGFIDSDSFLSSVDAECDECIALFLCTKYTVFDLYGIPAHGGSIAADLGADGLAGNAGDYWTTDDETGA